MPGIVDLEPPIDGEAAASAHVAEVPVDDTPPRNYVIIRQDVRIDIDFRDRRVRGESDIMVAPLDAVSEIFIDARQTRIDVSKITVSKCPVEASYQDPCIHTETPAPYRWTASQWPLRKSRMKPLVHHRREEISAVDHESKACCQPINGSIRVKLPSAEDIKQKNRGAPSTEVPDHVMNEDGSLQACTIRIPFELNQVTDGLHFVGVEEADQRYPHIYTRHSTEPGIASSIFPCIDDSGSRHLWKLSITCPRTLGDAFKRPRLAHGDAPNGSRKRKFGDEEPKKREVPMTEEDKILDMTVVCSGYLTGETIDPEDESRKTMTFEIDKPKAAKHVGFAVGPFEHVDLWADFRSEEDDVKLGVNATKVHGYCLPGRTEEVRNTCAALVTAIDHFVLQFGRYPFESYKVCFVDDMVEDTVPLCAFSLCSSRLLYPREIIDTEIDTTRVLVHSLACQWFGVNIVPNLKCDIWLIVGISWFMTDHFMKVLCGNNDFRFRMKQLADRLVQADLKRPSLNDLGELLYLGSFEKEFMDLKAPLVLFILDRRISKSSGSAGLPRIISKMVGSANTSAGAGGDVLTSEPFRKACEKMSSLKLDTFWSQWVTGSGCPRFEVFQRFNKKRLCVEMTVRQIQDMAAAKSRPLAKDDFWRDVMEENHEVYAGELQHSFTGPMTIRIHEADGTPYEHIVDIRDDQAKSTKFEIPYNTKYKRLKRNRRQREKQMAGVNAKGDEDGPDEAQLYSLGDVLQQPDEMEAWKLQDWDNQTEQKMDQESYEWIRMDADFEWVCDISTNLPAYMYVSQLQQDKDVAAQQDSMLYLNRSFAQTNAHPVVSTILARTLLDQRYYYGIRTMAADILPRHAVKHLDWVGLCHLRKTYERFFFQPDGNMPRPNDFSDKRQYFIQMAIPEAIAQVRGKDGKCPPDARRFILGLLQANNNKENIYSDQNFICQLIKALSICQITDEETAKKYLKEKGPPRPKFDEEGNVIMEPVNTEPQEFQDLALEEIERYRRMDEYSPSHQNCFTVAALDALSRLMKAKVIPSNPTTFVQYLLDRTTDLVRIKACECLVDLGMLDHAAFLRFFLTLIGTDPSPFVRDRLFKVLCRGVAGIAFGEKARDAKELAPPAPTEGDLVVDQGDRQIQAKQHAKARREDLTVALAALRDDTKDEELADAIWSVLDSPVLSISERLNLLELCSILVEEDSSLMLTFKYPTYWKATRGEKSRHRMVVNFKEFTRTKSRKTYKTPAPPKPEPKRTITLNLNRNASFSSKVGSPAVAQAPELPASTVMAKAPIPKAPPVASTPSQAPVAKPSTVVATPKRESTPLKDKQPVLKKENGTPKDRHSLPKEKPPKERLPLPKEKSSLPKERSSLPKEKSSLLKEKSSLSKESKEKSPLPKEKSSLLKDKFSLLKEKSPLPKEKSALPKEKEKEKSATPKDIHRDSISVHTPVRTSAEAPVPPPKSNGLKNNGSTPLPKLNKPPKRPHSEMDSDRPRKIVKLDTSKLPKERLARFVDKPKAKKPKVARKIVTVKFNAWSRLRMRQNKDTPKQETIRATPKQQKSFNKSHSNTPTRTPPPTIGEGQTSPSTATAGPGSSPSTIGASQTSSQSQSQSYSQLSASGKIRKKLPDMRKPLPAPGAGGHHSSPPLPSPSASHPKSASPPAPASQSSSKAPTKLKIKLKPSS